MSNLFPITIREDDIWYIAESPIYPECFGRALTKEVATQKLINAIDNFISDWEVDWREPMALDTPYFV